jgi:hypothetical protein
MLLDPIQQPSCLCSCCRAVGRPYVKQSSSDELRLLGVVSNLLGAVARVFTEQMPWQLQACTAEVCVHALPQPHRGSSKLLSHFCGIPQVGL